VAVILIHIKRARNWGIANILPILIVAYLGSRFPDIDQYTYLITHRSIFTHGFLFPLVLFFLSYKSKSTRFRSLVMVFLIAFAIHLCFDMYPKGWYMHALIHVPSIGWIPAIFSQIWIIVSIFICTYAAIRLIDNRYQAILFLLSTIAIFLYQGLSEITLLSPLVLLVIIDSIVIFKIYTKWNLRTHL